VLEIVKTVERVTAGHAVYDALERGDAYSVDVARIVPFLSDAGVSFDKDYLERVVRKYYGTTI
jgi:hypothetical protein